METMPAYRYIKKIAKSYNKDTYYIFLSKIMSIIRYSNCHGKIVVSPVFNINSWYDLPKKFKKRKNFANNIEKGFNVKQPSNRYGETIFYDFISKKDKEDIENYLIMHGRSPR